MKNCPALVQVSAILNNLSWLTIYYREQKTRCCYACRVTSVKLPGTVCHFTRRPAKCVWGSSIYPLHAHLQTPFRNAVLTQEMRLFNSTVSVVRISVEWLFGDILNYFKFVDFKKNLKIGLSSIVKMYVVSVLLCAMQWHVFIIIRHPVIFNLEPPTLQEYFR